MNYFLLQTKLQKPKKTNKRKKSEVIAWYVNEKPVWTTPGKLLSWTFYIQF